MSEETEKPTAEVVREIVPSLEREERPVSRTSRKVVRSQGKIGKTVFAKTLNEQMKKSKLTRGELATRIGMHDATISNWIRGEYDPSIDGFDRLVRVFPEMSRAKPRGMRANSRTGKAFGANSRSVLPTGVSEIQTSSTSTETPGKASGSQLDAVFEIFVLLTSFKEGKGTMKDVITLLSTATAAGITHEKLDVFLQCLNS